MAHSEPAELPHHMQGKIPWLRYYINTFYTGILTIQLREQLEFRCSGFEVPPQLQLIGRRVSPQYGRSYSSVSYRLSHALGNTSGSKMDVTDTQSNLENLEESAGMELSQRCFQNNFTKHLTVNTITTSMKWVESVHGRFILNHLYYRKWPK